MPVTGSNLDFKPSENITSFVIGKISREIFASGCLL